jgi:uncharacterized protein YjbJ (UPF0337 family)
MRFFESDGITIYNCRSGLATINKRNLEEDNTMKNSTKDTAKGLFHQLAGKAKVLTGKVIKSPGLEAEGNVEKVAGKIQKKTGQAKKSLKK